MSSAGFKVPGDVMAPLIFVVCVPTLLLLFYSLCFPEHVGQLFGSGPLALMSLGIGMVTPQGPKFTWFTVIAFA